MPLCKKLSAHPAHLEFLHRLVNAGDAKSIDGVKRAVRVLDAIEASLEALDPSEPTWIDPAIVRTQEECDKASALPGFPKDARYDPAAQAVVTFSEDEFQHARSCFAAALERARGLEARSLLALSVALDHAEPVTA